MQATPRAINTVGETWGVAGEGGGGGQKLPQKLPRLERRGTFASEGDGVGGRRARARRGLYQE